MAVGREKSEAVMKFAGGAPVPPPIPDHRWAIEERGKKAG